MLKDFHPRIASAFAKATADRQPGDDYLKQNIHQINLYPRIASAFAKASADRQPGDDR